ncbi:MULTISPECIES: FMN-binding protein [Marichromatium]|uniref:Ion-translocating oxidoreductase complex subunit G n=1 Tax=Marichromatium gracile TaxID=1048 RepID=A0A4R4A573_MARGR|nr:MULTISPECIES: FMN-binding protein [Marichromatium]MBO8085325.1 FMN-binding protein [Marichromatium sp.]MBK1709496.1 FMN-binding protein [Marichromatium gracile]RNE88875.1 FMN-binding protein [Marichromatium sp. AB31]RNE93137.1 FMN-binding protein [Marichromatium sp. AB32]TCW33181.1 electron transport complex protein RnfG [Marichromatium gracile]
MTIEQQIQTPAPSTPAWAMLRTLGGIAMLSGLLVVLVYQFTLPIIAENQRRMTEKAVFHVLDGAVAKRDFVLTAEDALVPAGEGAEGVHLYAGYDDDGALVGVAFPGAARGYQDVIQFLFGYDPACQCVIGSKVLKSTETPGLGDKISTDAEYLKNFEALDARLDATGTALANPIVPVKHGTKTQPWQVDAISGATITSNAMARAVNDAAQRVVPVLQRELALLSEPNRSEGR